MKRSQKEMWLKSLPKLKKNKQKKQMITVTQVQVLHASILFMKSTKRLESQKIRNLLSPQHLKEFWKIQRKKKLRSLTKSLRWSKRKMCNLLKTRSLTEKNSRWFKQKKIVSRKKTLQDCAKGEKANAESRVQRSTKTSPGSENPKNDSSGFISIIF